MSDVRISRLQKYIAALLWKSMLEKRCLALYTEDIYGFYGDSRTQDHPRFEHKHAVSISRALKRFEPWVANKLRLRTESSTCLIVYKPDVTLV